MLLDLYQRRNKKNKNKNLTVDDFIDVGARYMDKKELQNQVVRHMIQGQPIDFKNVKLMDEFEVEINDSIPKINLTQGAVLTTIYQW